MKKKLLITVSLFNCLFIYQSANAVPCPNLNAQEANQIVTNLQGQNPTSIFRDDAQRRWDVTVNFGIHHMPRPNAIQNVALQNATGNSDDIPQGHDTIHICRYNLTAQHIHCGLTLETVTSLPTSVNTSEREQPRLGRNPFLGQNQPRQGNSTGVSTQ
jgi:hypothetical protein